MAVEPPQRTFTFRDALELPSGTVFIADRDFRSPVRESFMPETALWIDMCLTPRPEGLKVRYVNHWPPHRFERVGQIFAMPAGEPLEFRGGTGSQTSVVCQLQPDRLDYPAALRIDWTERRLESCLDLPSPRLSTLLRYLAEEVRRRDLEREVLADLMLRQLAIELARLLRHIEEPIAIGGLAAWRLKLIDERLAQSGPPPSLGELARLGALSVRQLTRAFRASRGCSVNDYISEFRMERAKRLLTGKAGIKAIAFELGFTSASIFSHAFRRHVGITPREFRAQASASRSAG